MEMAEQNTTTQHSTTMQHRQKTNAIIQKTKTYAIRKKTKDKTQTKD